MEWIDIYDDTFNKIGSQPRSVVHAKGLAHYVFHCWVLDPSKTYIVIQQRSVNKAFGAGKMDISCAGHYASQDTFETTRELYEELGIEVGYKALNYLYDFDDHFIYGQMDDRERARVHLLTYDLSQIAPVCIEEIESIYTCKLQAFIALSEGRVHEVPLLTLEGKATGRSVSLCDFVERRSPYYKWLAKALRDFK